jgi:hypothetical protein
METPKDAKSQETKMPETHDHPTEGSKPSDNSPEVSDLHWTEIAEPSGKFQIGQNPLSPANKLISAPELSFLPEIQPQSSHLLPDITPHALIATHELVGFLYGTAGVRITHNRGTAEQPATIELLLLTHHKSPGGGFVKTQTSVIHKRRDGSPLAFILVNTFDRLRSRPAVPIQQWSVFRVSAEKLPTPPTGACILTVDRASEPSQPAQRYSPPAPELTTQPQDTDATHRPAPAGLKPPPRTDSSHDSVLSIIRACIANVDTVIHKAANGALSTPPHQPGALVSLLENRLRNPNPPGSEGLFGAAQNLHGRVDDNNDAEDDDVATDDRWCPRATQLHVPWQARNLPRPFDPIRPNPNMDRPIPPRPSPPYLPLPSTDSFLPDWLNLIMSSRPKSRPSVATTQPAVPSDLVHASFDFQPPPCSGHTNPFTSDWRILHLPPALTPQGAAPFQRLPPMMTRPEDAVEDNEDFDPYRPRV